MASDPKATPATPSTPVKQRGIGIRIFTYPKTIFIFPTLIIAFVCGCVMSYQEHHRHNANAPGTVRTVETSGPDAAVNLPASKVERFNQPDNLVGVLFLVVLAFNLLIMAVDFPRFTVVGLLLAVLFGLFFLLWLGAYFHFDLANSVRNFFGNIYAYANSGFYFSITAVLVGIFVIVWLTRWLDYWEIMPNEILHHHGPLSDLERYPTMNLKFDKEIPDVFEFLFLGSGRLVLHVSDERKSIVLDNVLFINAKEEALKKLMSRLEVRITTDQEVAEP
ncbi:MAG: hypothetical protein P4L84_26330 [Isosphaeraceae bacterium]|nr:hypothetical protein [Isosphaeraceae bacterium]